ncbi:NifB/NifX family molybdenum-iron cluster-binding protein [Vibrio fluvialis]|nr:hypothetical protein [Vibrio fluvialis]
MKYALPIQNQRLSNHFSKAPQFLLFDSQTGKQQWLDIEVTEEARSEHHCGKKKTLLALLKQHQVDAVVVRNIGQSMLASLFSSGVKVFSSPAIHDIGNLSTTQLTPVTDMNYARPSAHKSAKPCTGHSACGHQDACCHKPVDNTKLKPRTLEKLQRVLKIHR